MFGEMCADGVMGLQIQNQKINTLWVLAILLNGPTKKEVKTNVLHV